MPVYKWEGTSKQGATLKGETTAANEAVLRELLRKKNIRLREVKTKPKDIFANIEFFQQKVTTKDLILFTRQFSTMIDSGLPLLQGLEILAAQADNPTFKKVITQIKTDVEGGSAFAEALKKHPNVYDNLYVNRRLYQLQ